MPCEVPVTDEERIRAKQQVEKYYSWKWSEEAERDICNDRNSRFVSQRKLGLGYGLTNQLLAHLGLFALAARTNRIATVAGSARIPLPFLLNFSTTILPPGVRMVRSCPRLPHSRDVTKGIADKKIQAVDRKNVMQRAHKVMHRIDAYFFPSQLPHTRYIELYLRYPFEQEANLDYSMGA